MNYIPKLEMADQIMKLTLMAKIWFITPCNSACLLLTPEQRKQLATPIYKLRKEKKSSTKQEVLVDPSSVNVVGLVDLNQSTASATSSTNISLDDSSFKKELTDLKDEWSTRFK